MTTTNNKGWLQWVEIGGKIIAVGAIIAGSVLSGGTLAPILIGAGTAYLVADSGYQAVSGETISGKRLTDGERIWAGVDAVLTAATGGFATYASVLAKTGKAATTTVQTVGKVVNYADDANDIAHTVTAMQDDPLGAALQFGIGRAIGHGSNVLGNKARARFGKGGSGADVDLPSSGKGVDLPAGNAGLKIHADTDVDPSTLGTGKKPKPEIQTPQHQEIPSPSKKPELDVTKTSKPEIDRASSPEITGPSKKSEIDTTKTAKPEIDNPSRPAVDKTNSKPSEIDTGKTVKPEVSQARPSEVASPNSRPKEVDVTKKPDIEASRPAEVNPTMIKPEMETKVKPDIDAAAASASAVPKVKAQEPDLPKAGQPEVTPDAGKKVQKPEEVDNPNSDKGISQQTPRVIPGQDGVVTGGSSTKLGKNMMEDMGLSRGQKWTGYQAQHIIPADMADHPVIQKMGMDLDDASNGKFLPVPDSVDTTSVSPLSRHRGYHSTYNEFVRAQLDNIDVNQSPAMLQKEVKELQRKLGILQDKGLPLYPKFGATAELWERFMKNLD